MSEFLRRGRWEEDQPGEDHHSEELKRAEWGGRLDGGR